jgi:hypothetical protein
MLMNALTILCLCAMVGAGVLVILRGPVLIGGWFRSGTIKIELAVGELGHVYRASHPKLFLAAVALYCACMMVVLGLSILSLLGLYSLVTEGIPQR